jgi:hypothetical protein
MKKNASEKVFRSKDVGKGPTFLSDLPVRGEIPTQTKT